MSEHRTAGFILIELMIVLAIPGIQLSIAIPAYQDMDFQKYGSQRGEYLPAFHNRTSRHTPALAIPNTMSPRRGMILPRPKSLRQ